MRQIKISNKALNEIDEVEKELLESNKKSEDELIKNI